jgi:spore maturation protein CgeB
LADQLDIVFLGLSITSSWGNGHATTYRALIRELTRRGHRVTFLERDVPWYASQRDLPQPEFCELELYGSLDELRDRFATLIARADAVIVGSYVPDGVAVGEWVTETARGATAFYDIDTPVTIAKLLRNDYEYLTPALIAKYDRYLSFTGGPMLDQIERDFGSPNALPLYCSFDPENYYKEEEVDAKWDLGYMGTYSDDRQPRLNELLVLPAQQLTEGRFVVAGPQYPSSIRWSPNIERIEHLPPAQHRRFYNRQRFTLNVTRDDMIRAGYSPSVRLFEAAACGVPIISDYWPGLEDFFRIGTEILVARSAAESIDYLQHTSHLERERIGENARRRVMAEHTAAHRAEQLEGYLNQSIGERNNKASAYAI